MYRLQFLLIFTMGNGLLKILNFSTIYRLQFLPIFTMGNSLLKVAKSPKTKQN
jgi:hypothetical protein